MLGKIEVFANDNRGWTALWIWKLLSCGDLRTEGSSDVKGRDRIVLGSFVHPLNLHSLHCLLVRAELVRKFENTPK